METMKRLMLFIIALTSSATVSAEWLRVGENSNFVNYIDPSRIRIDGDMRVYWELLDLKPGVVPKGFPAKSMLIQMETDCRTERYRALFQEDYEGQMAGGKVVHTINDADKWSPITPNDTRKTFMLQLICGLKTN